MRANESRERVPDDWLREAIHGTNAPFLDCFVRFAPRNDDKCGLVLRTVLHRERLYFSPTLNGGSLPGGTVSSAIASIIATMT